MSIPNVTRKAGPWGAATLERGQSVMLRVGPLSVSVTSLPREWMVAYRREHGDLERFEDAHVERGERALEAPDATERFLVRESSSTVAFVPTLADRSVVSRPERPFHVPAGEAANLFLSSPVWVRLSLADSKLPLVEIPTSISSDTWVGPSTRSGELCYASRTLARTRLDEVPLRPHRVVTPLTIENRAENHLRIDRVNIPCPNLSVFVGERGFLWTEAVTLVREEDGDLARLRIHEGASEPARGGDRLTTPRERVEADSLFRAFSSFFQ